jgi:UDPglucose 6-dehydrogenase
MELVEKAQLKSKVNLVYSPEFIALGSVLNDLEFPDMILVGTFDGEENTEYTLIQKKMAKNKPQVVNLNYTEAEYAKILVNTYITMKISFANFIGEIGSQIAEFNPAKVAFAVGLDSRINNKYLKPGLPFSGPCFPRDNRALVSSARAIGLKANLAIATDDINSRQMEFLAEKVLKRSENANSFSIFGLSYKVGSEVIEESAGIRLANYLADRGFDVQCHDPAISVRPASLNSKVHFAADLGEIGDYDQGVVITDWPIYELEFGNVRKVFFLSKIDKY